MTASSTATRTARRVLKGRYPLMLAWVASMIVHTEANAQLYPLQLSNDRRYVVDNTGAPFPILGRTAWFITSLSQAEYRLFLDDTAAKGYTTFEFHVINHDARGNHPPFDGNGALPFSTRLGGGDWDGTQAPDLTTPNEPYWTHVDEILAYGESRGLLAFLFPAYLGYNGGEQGWMQELVANGPARVQSYGAWIAARYATRANIVWMMGGDFGSFDDAQTAVEQALLNGLQSVAGQRSTVFSAEWDSESIATDQPDFGPAMTLNGAYSWTGQVAAHCRRAYAYTPTKPAFLLEEPYDEEGPDGNEVNPFATQPVRRFQWWGWLSSIGGYVSGNGYIWPFNPGWQDHLNPPGAQDMARLNAFIRSIDWPDLVPSQLGGTGPIVTSGGADESSESYVAAAAAADGSTIVAYIPPAHTGTITIDMARVARPARARWYNPTTAVYTTIETDLPNAGTHPFTAPGDNGSGDSDWVLVLDIAGDVNRDGRVDLADLAVLLSAFGSCAGSGTYVANADLDASSCVDLADLSVLLSRFGG